MRELKALIEIEKEPGATDMARLLRLACHAANRAGQSPVRPSFVAVFTARYRRIVADGLAFHEAQPPLDPRGKPKRGRPKRRPGHNLVIRLSDHEDAVLRFLDGIPDVTARDPITIGNDVPSMLKSDLDLEYGAVTALRDAIAVCETAGDYHSREILVSLLEDTEMDHAYWLEQQLGLVERMGLENYIEHAARGGGKAAG